MRLRREPEPNPEVQRALAALDAALAGEDVDAEHDDLRQLAVALRDERPQPRPEFELALDLRVHEGFPREDRAGIHQATPAQRRELHKPHRLRTTPLALGTAAAIFIVATAALTTGLLGGGNDRNPNQPPQELEDTLGFEGSGASTGQPATGATEQRDQAAAPPPATVAPQARDRQVGRSVERSAELVLSTPRDRIEDVADGVVRVTDRHGGFVLGSTVSAGANAGAQLELKVPGERVQQAVADLSGLAHVRSRTQAARDITSDFVPPRRRLADALAERRVLLRRLAAAATANEVTAIRARLRAVNRRIDRAQSVLRRLRDRVGFSLVSVSVEPGRDEADGGGWSLGDAAGDALTVLGVIAGATIIGMAVAIPAGILALVAWLAYRALIQRRRERALDLPPTTHTASD